MRRDRRDLARFESGATKLALRLVVAGPVLGFIAIPLGAAEVFPYEYTLPVALTLFFGPMGLALLIGAVGGLYVMGGLKFAPFGVTFVAGFAALVYGLGTADHLWRLIGIALLAVSGGAFFALGTAAERVPAGLRHRWAFGAALAGGVLITVAGQVAGLWWLVLAGAMAAGCGAGGLLGRLWSARN